MYRHETLPADDEPMNVAQRRLLRVAVQTRVPLNNAVAQMLAESLARREFGWITGHAFYINDNGRQAVLEDLR